MLSRLKKVYLMSPAKLHSQNLIGCQALDTYYGQPDAYTNIILEQ